MQSGIKRLWRDHKLLLLAFLLAATLTIIFAARMVIFSVYWASPDHKNQLLEGWMTPRYIAHSYRLERGDVRRILGFDPAPDSHQRLEDLIKDQSVTMEYLQGLMDGYVATQASE